MGLARQPLLLSAALLALGLATPGHAQGCVAARMDAPLAGIQGGAGCDTRSHWELTTSWRYYYSHRHYVGHVEQRYRAREGSQVKNSVNQLEVNLRYTFGPRWDLGVTIPYLDANRSSPVRDPNRVVVSRYTTHAQGMGDVSILARRWMLDPAKHHRGNVTLGFGVKLPTGNERSKDLFYKYGNGGRIPDVVRNVDQSIQPGDGGFGQILDVSGYFSSKKGAVAFYGSFNYLFNPEVTDHVTTGRSSPLEKYMSISDQFLGRAGALFGGPRMHGWSLGAGARWEGVPAHDVFGSSRWFRRPGFGISFEPSLAYVRGHDSFSLAAPLAIYRDRTHSQADLERGTQGDAAFADYSVQFAYSHRFGSH